MDDKAASIHGRIDELEEAVTELSYVVSSLQQEIMVLLQRQQKHRDALNEIARREKRRAEEAGD